MSEVLTEIAKIDPSFDKIEWLRFCEKEIIPNILEAFIRGDLDVLQDWCHERVKFCFLFVTVFFQAFNILANVLKEYEKIKFSTRDSRIIDISKVEVSRIDHFTITPIFRWYQVK